MGINIRDGVGRRHLSPSRGVARSRRNCARLTGSKRCISVLRGAFWGKGWGTLVLPHPPPRKCYTPLSLSLSRSTSSGSTPTSSLPTQVDASQATLSAAAFVRPTPTSLLPPLFALPPRSLPLRRRSRAPTPLASPTSQARMYPISRSFRLAFFPSFSPSSSFAPGSFRRPPLYVAPLLKGVKVLFLSFFFLLSPPFLRELGREEVTGVWSYDSRCFEGFGDCNVIVRSCMVIHCHGSAWIIVDESIILSKMAVHEWRYFIESIKLDA